MTSRIRNDISSFLTCSVDAVLSIAVIHHIATAERRVHALRELSRVLRVGGRVMISVWAMEQRQRRFESQDVLIPWHRPTLSHSLEVFCLLSLFTFQLFVHISAVCLHIFVYIRWPPAAPTMG